MQQTRITHCLTLLLFTFIACNTFKSPKETQTLDFGYFTLEAPQGWKAVKAKGIDSYVGKIAIDNKDTLNFDLGWYSFNLNESGLHILDSSLLNVVDSTTVDIHAIHFVNDKSLIDSYYQRKTNMHWDTINGYRAKVVTPIHSGKGFTGIYIDSLWGSGDQKDRFNLYGVDLQPKNEQKLLQVIQTLRFTAKP